MSQAHRSKPINPSKARPTLRINLTRRVRQHLLNRYPAVGRFLALDSAVTRYVKYFLLHSTVRLTIHRNPAALEAPDTQKQKLCNAAARPPCPTHRKPHGWASTGAAEHPGGKLHLLSHGQSASTLCILYAYISPREAISCIGKKPLLAPGMQYQKIASDAPRCTEKRISRYCQPDPHLDI